MEEMLRRRIEETNQKISDYLQQSSQHYQQQQAFYIPQKMQGLRAAGLVEPQRLDFGSAAVKNTFYDDEPFVVERAEGHRREGI